MWNKTPSVNAKKIKLVLKSRHFISLVILVVCVGMLAASIVFLQKPDEALRENTAAVRLGSQKFSLDIADTDSKRMQGLSGREQLAKDQGMLFVFPIADRQCMWMKDMYVSLDMVWLDSQKEVVSIQTDIAPDTYPQQFCADNAQYVIELPAGATQNMGLQVGEQLDF